MATKAIQGRKASLSIQSASSGAAVLVAEAKNYKFSVTDTLIDVTSNDSSGWKESIEGPRSWSMDAQALHISTGAALVAIHKALSSGTLRYVVLTPATAKTFKLKGWVNVKSWDIAGDQQDAWLTNFSVEGTRALVITS